MKIKDLLKNESKWTRESLARDMNGFSVAPESEEAISFCVWGAIRRCYNNIDELRFVAEKIDNELRKRGRTFSFGGCTRSLIPDWNDDLATTHEMVIDVLNTVDV